ncbi:MAG TPA: ribosome biogenesis GTPase Der [Myxococcota bacterium]|nr:ribosome biogenesis GTPase Der [Myxococcota bacterium]
MTRSDTSSPPLVAIVGRANVGKSTLFNRLLREGRSLVEDRPGVTRDRVAVATEIERRPVLLVDTGGLDPEAEEGIPAAIRRQVGLVVSQAAVIVFVVDARAGLLPLDRQIAELLRKGGRPVVVVANKSDSPQIEAHTGEFHALGFGTVVPTCAAHARGLPDLELAIAEALPERSPDEETPARSGPPRLAIIGRPNVGKSSLLNALLGEERNIVADEPGTTRDSTDSSISVGGRQLILVDTAGMRRGGKRSDRLERGSALMALRSLERCDVALLVIDADVGVSEQDSKLARLALDRGRPLVLLLNKWDKVSGTPREEELTRQLERRLGFVPDPVLLRTSAVTRLGLERVLPEALALYDALELEIPTSELNRALEDAILRNTPPLRGKKRARFFYATQISTRPLTLLVFMNDPQLIARNYHRYLEGFMRKRFGVRSAPVRVKLRGRRELEAGTAELSGPQSKTR